MTNLRRVVLLAALFVAAVPTANAFAGYGGAALQNPGAGMGVSNSGNAYPRIYCASGTWGFCTGWVTISRSGRVLGRTPFSIRSNDGPTVAVPMKPSNKKALLAGGRNVTVTIQSHDGWNPPQFHSITQVSFLKG